MSMIRLFFDALFFMAPVALVGWALAYLAAFPNLARLQLAGLLETLAALLR